jgi:SAM-dependent methyltransferase
MLKKAALNTIEINQELIKSNLMLQDAYPWNITFKATEPVFLDVTSVIKESPTLIWPAYEQFESFFARPLALMQYGLGKIARQAYLNQIEGISLPDYYKLLPFREKFRSPHIVLSNFLNRRAQSNPNIKRKINNFVKLLNNRPCSTEIRIRFFQSLHNKISALKNADHTDVWENYYKEIPQEWDKNFKIEQVKMLLEKTKPSTVVDVGCNTGIFSSIAAEHNARVISVDSSERCIESLYHHAKTKKLNILPLLSDALSPTPGFGFMGQQFTTLWDRVKGDVVFCLGLMHHLHIAGRQSFENIAKLFFHITNKWVIFEYVDKEDENNQLIESIRLIDYNFEEVLDILSNYFKIREILDSDRPTRKLLLLEKMECS